MLTVPPDERLQEILDELARSGSPVDQSVAAPTTPNAVEIWQVGEIHSSSVFELDNGQVAYSLNVSIFNKKTRPIDVIACEIRTTWEDGLFRWLAPITRQSRGREKRPHNYEVYRFPGDFGPEFHGEDVLNHHLQEGERLPGREALSGWLLAVGGRIPAQLRHGQWIDADLVITDADRVEHSTKLELWVSRPPRRPKPAKVRKRIFAKPQEVATEARIQANRSDECPPGAIQTPAAATESSEPVEP